MKTKKIKQMNQGELFRLSDSDNAPVWVRGEYVREERKYSTHKFEDVCHEKLINGDKKVFVDFEY